MLTTTTTTGAAPRNPLAEMLIEEMARRKWSAAELARAVGVNRSTVYMWTANGVIPSLAQRAAIASVLGTTMDAVQAKVAEVERLRIEARGARPDRGPAESTARDVHPALLKALALLDWDGQAALARVLAGLRETKLQEFRDGDGLTWATRRADTAISNTSSISDATGEGRDDEGKGRRPAPRSRAGREAQARGEDPPWRQ